MEFNFRKYKLVILVAAVALTAGITLFLTRDPGDWAARIGGEYVAAGEYRVYLYEQIILFEDVGGEDIWDTDFGGETPEEVAKRNALRRVALVRETAKRCAENNISLSGEDRLNVSRSAAELYAEFPPLLTEKQDITPEITQKVMEDMELYEMMYKRVTENYVLSETDFEAYFSDYIETSDMLSSEEAVEDLAKIKEAVREEYVIMKKNEIFDAEYAKWSEGVETVVNNAVLGEIHISDFDG